ncbi:hypothetical protein [Virgibacillus dakarensis]|uniref:hypothetical protein n=1 Tax=Virgibacillus dakarensis TaxID=1917889 RepID=UPI000B44F1EC|nr:hypothetical protein [Virgibacillus dakarensis]
MNIEVNQEEFLEEMFTIKSNLVKALSSENVEKYREEYIGKYSLERFKEFFIEKAALHTLFKYFLIRMIEESMGRVKVKLNEDGLKKWHQMSKNFREDYNLLLEFAEKDVKREHDLAEIFIESIYDEKQFNDKTSKVLAEHIPTMAKYDFATLDANTTLSVIDKLYNLEKREELQRLSHPSPILNFLLQQVGLL